MDRKSIMPYVMITAGALVGLAGAVLVAVYVVEAVVTRIGEADQSLLFWYLPIALVGIGSLALGSGLGFRGVRQLRKGP